MHATRSRLLTLVAPLSCSLLLASGCPSDPASGAPDPDPFADYEPDPDVFMEPVDENGTIEIEEGLWAARDQLLVLVDSSVERERVDELASTVGGEVVGQIPKIGVYQLLLPTETKEELLSATDELLAHAYVDSVAPNLITQYDGESDPEYCNATDDNHMNLEGNERCAHEGVGYYQASVLFDAIRPMISLNDVRIAVIDSGLEPDTNQFDDIPILNLDNPGSDPIDDNGHGTIVAGVIAADDGDGGVNGIATRLLGPDKVQLVVGTGGTLSGCVLSMYRAGVDARSDVVNMSWGWKFETPTQWWEAVANVVVQPIRAAPNTLFVAAAGNHGEEVTLLRPPAGLSPNEDNLITVGGTAQCNREERWSSSGWGSSVDMAAPGERVPALKYYPSQGYGDTTLASGKPWLISGTSLSAPIVASVAAVLRSIDPNLSPSAVFDDYLSKQTYPSSPDLGWGQVLTTLPTMQLIIDRNPPQGVRDIIELEDDAGHWNNPGLAVNRLCGGAQINIEREGSFQFNDEEHAAGFWNEMGMGIIFADETRDITVQFGSEISGFELDHAYSMPTQFDGSYARSEASSGGVIVSGEFRIDDCAVLDRNPLNNLPMQVQMHGRFDGVYEAQDLPDPNTYLASFDGTYSIPIVVTNTQAILSAEAQCTGGLGEGAWDEGAVMFANLGCGNCHDAPEGFPLTGPNLEGIWGTTVPLEGGGNVTVDEAYLRESILNPSAKIVAGYEDVMPSFDEQLSDAQVDTLVDYIAGL
jgi:subtilisin family serine protease